MRVLIVGRGGQVATELRALLPDAVALEPPDLDIANAASVGSAITAYRPDIVVNAAAYTAVDRAEAEPALAHAINADGPAFLGAATAAAGIPVVHLSTDYVFDGTKGAPYTEADPTNPLGVYGASKLAGEQRLQAANARAITLRTAWVCSAHGANFLKTMLRLAAERPVLRVVADQHGAPTFAADLARAIVSLLPRLVAAPAGDPCFGVFHFTGTPHTTWHGFATVIMAEVAARGHAAPSVEEITTADHPTPARRPADGRLDCGRAERMLGLEAPDWRPALADCLDRLLPIRQQSSP